MILTKRIALVSLCAVTISSAVTACSSDSKTEPAAKASTSSSASAGGSSSQRDSTAIIGTWNVKVSTSLPSSGGAKLIFKPDGTLDQIGTDTLLGTGYWQPSLEQNKYILEVVIPLKNRKTNTIIGTIRARQNVTLDDKGGLVATGSSSMFTPEGKMFKTFTINSTGSGKQ
jgi:hypothetical protein